MFIDFFAKIGWAYDLRQPSRELIDKTLWKHGKNSKEVVLIGLKDKEYV
jgi:hypothetical protein